MGEHTKKGIASLKKARKMLEKCGGICRECEKCHIYVSDRALCCAVGCDALPSEIFAALANGPKSLHKRAIEAVDFELELVEVTA